MDEQTLKLVEDGICIQMRRLADGENYGPNEWSQIANAGANLLDKLTNYLQQESMCQSNRDRNEIDLKKVEIEQRKVEVDEKKNDIDSVKISTQESIELQKIDIEYDRLENDKKAAQLRYDSEMNKTKAENNWKKVAVDIAKIAVPAAVSVVTLKVWGDSMHDLMSLEETGKICTTVANKFMKLPHLTGF